MDRIFYNNRSVRVIPKADGMTGYSGRNGYFSQQDDTEEMRRLMTYFESHSELSSLEVISADPQKCFTSLCKVFDNIDAAGGIVQNERKEYLLIRRHRIWDLPKGKREQGETPEETALREVMEECGLSEVKILKPCTITRHCYRREGRLTLKRTFWYHMFAPKAQALRPQIEEDIEKVQWVDPRELPSYMEHSYNSIRFIFNL